MRADRLVAALLLLQTRGRVTARQLADELEVSEKTARRDLEALGVAGFPVYAERGRNGGWRLLGGGRTDLSGLNVDEARALFQLAGTAVTATPEVRSALRKLVRALPETFRAGAQAAADSLVIDPAEWGRERSPHTSTSIDALRTAVIEQRRVRLRYRDRTRSETERVVEPLGLVTKASTWYLVAAIASAEGDADKAQRSFRIDRIVDAVTLDEHFDRPDGFDLNTAWGQVVERVQELRTPIRAVVHAPGWAAHALRHTFGADATIGPTLPDGNVEVTIGTPRADRLAERLAGWGNLVTVVEPPEVREHLVRIATDVLALYRDEPAATA